MLRKDSDGMLIGKIRDAITAKYAFRDALTGHLVLTTIHANNGKGTLERLKDIGISELDIKQTVKSIICLDLILLRKFKEKRRRAGIAEIIMHEINAKKNIHFKELYFNIII